MPFTFQNRPPVAVEPLTLGSGDIEAVEMSPRVPGFPPPPMARPSSLPRGAGPQPPARPRQVTRVPAASPSLAPVAMSAVRGRADSTVPPPRSSSAEVVVRTRPSLKMGLSILMAGAIVGSILGITTAPRPAAAAYQPALDAVPVHTADAKDDLPAPAAKNDGAKDAPKDSADAKDATTDEAKTDRPASAKKKRVGGAARIASATTAEKPEKPEKPAKPTKAEKPSKDDDDDGYRVASANPDEKPAKAAPAAKKKPAAKEEDDDDAPAPPPKKKPKASEDARDVLRAAMGATENTL